MAGLEPPQNPHDNRQTAILINVLLSFIVAAIITTLRMITRIWVVRNVGWDDYTIVAATLGHCIGMGLVLCELHYGFGTHREFVSDSAFLEFMKCSYVEWIQTFQTLMFNKLSVCLFLLRLPVSKQYTRPLQGAVIFLIVSNIILTFLWIFQCSPVSGSWTQSATARCMTYAQLERIIISQALISLISDVLLALFPIAILWKVQISPRIKVGLCSLMALGLITAGLCTVRTVLNWENVNEDPTWESIPNWAFRSWEVTVGITAASIPSLRPGYRVVRTYLFTYYTTHYGSLDSYKPSNKSFRYRKESDDTLVAAAGGANIKKVTSAGDLEERAQLAQELTHPTPARVAAHMASVEADRAAAVGAGDEDFAMGDIAGDLPTMGQGIKKTTWFGTESNTDLSRERSSGTGELERSETGRGFV